MTGLFVGLELVKGFEVEIEWVQPFFNLSYVQPDEVERRKIEQLNRKWEDERLRMKYRLERLILGPMYNRIPKIGDLWEDKQNWDTVRMEEAVRYYSRGG